jgi:hypothetical protein
MKSLLGLLRGEDLRSITGSNEVVKRIQSQGDFDRLFKLLQSQDQLVVMRAADAIEKITLKRPEYLRTHKMELLSLMKSVGHIELKWHLALLSSRIDWNTRDLKFVCNLLTQWASDKEESKIVRVNSLQGLSELSKRNPKIESALNNLMLKLCKEDIPSLNARIKKLTKAP